MNQLEKILTTINSDLELSKNINTSQYTQSVEHIENSNNIYHNNITNCIIWDVELDKINNNNNIYFNQKIVEICNEINFDKLQLFKFNKKFKFTRFQQGLMKSIDNDNTLSALVYLRELTNTNYILIFNDIIYNDTVKNYETKYIICKNDKYRIIDNIDKYSIKNELTPITNDIKGSIYETELLNITKYKLQDLINMASKLNINKTGKKKDLYDRIYKHLLNN